MVVLVVVVELFVLLMVKVVQELYEVEEWIYASMEVARGERLQGIGWQGAVESLQIASALVVLVVNQFFYQNQQNLKWEYFLGEE